MRKLAMIGIAFLLVISIAYAGVLNYYGKIVGNVNVQGPIFYASTDNIDGSYYRLYVNNLPEGKKGNISFDDSTTLYFVTKPLGVTGWYAANWTIKVNIGTNNTVNNKVLVFLDFVEGVDGNYSSKASICTRQEITLDSTTNKTYEIVCPSSEITGLSPSDMLQLTIYGTGPTSEYTLYVDGTTRVEVIKP
jgi:hypothetical protein